MNCNYWASMPLVNEDTMKRLFYSAIRTIHEPSLRRFDARVVGAIRESPFYKITCKLQFHSTKLRQWSKQVLWI